MPADRQPQFQGGPFLQNSEGAFSDFILPVIFYRILFRPVKEELFIQWIDVRTRARLRRACASS